MLDYKGNRIYADRSEHTQQYELEPLKKANFTEIGMNNNFDECPF
jgi:hypothetical protein